ncbi:MAG: hypothetical protein P8Z36_01540 [Gemmatimonadota bacterium]
MTRWLLCLMPPLVCLVRPTPTPAQAPPDPPRAYPVGLAVSYGVGAYGVRDEAISTQRYEGTLPYLSVSWTRDHTRYIYRVEMEFRRSEEIRNYTVSTTITRFVLGQAFIYPVGTRTALGRDVGFFLGPTSEVALLLNEQHIAVDALGFAQSVAALLSLGLQADALMPVSQRITALASLRSSVISLGIRAVDDEIDDASPARLLTLLDGVNASLETGAIYRLGGRLSFRLAYLFQLGRIAAWQPVLDSSDSIVGRLSWRF